MNENRQKILQGQLDSQLNDLGRRQAQTVALALKDERFTHAYSSDLIRAKDTAEAILQYHQVYLVTMKELREKSFGDAEGLPIGTKVKNRGESVAQFRARVLGWWTKVMSEHLSNDLFEEKPTILLVVSHGGFIRTLLEALTTQDGFSFEAKSHIGHIPNTGVTTIQVSDVSRGQIISCGDDSHLSTFGEQEAALKINVDELLTA
ncbi:SubName: Full=Uncharacterized protein {ECO:0000313/EMBL:CCA78077.1} [Serendipita indica DSM 11827]|nr:SubName: Full=Uncharacterized protein {ECO:0000313/EMBL:CCA78077.1} [Serendipita indica DSM 11827]